VRFFFRVGCSSSLSACSPSSSAMSSTSLNKSHLVTMPYLWQREWFELYSRIDASEKTFISRFYFSFSIS
jgi:hypothetical protein